MKLTLPYPPSANRYWRNWRGRMVRSKEATAYMGTVAALALRAGLRGVQYDGAVGVTVTLYRPAKRGDLDNSLKVLLDSLRGIAYADDSQVVRLFAERFDDQASPRAEVTVFDMAEVVAGRPA